MAQKFISDQDNSDNPQKDSEVGVPEHSDGPVITDADLEPSNSENEEDMSSGEGEAKVGMSADEVVDHSNSEVSESDETEVEEILASGVAVDTEAVAKEREEIGQALLERDYWFLKQGELVGLIDGMVAGFSKVMEKFETQDKALTTEIRNELTSRAEGIRLCNRMIKRAQIRSSQMVEPNRNDDYKIPDPLSFDLLLPEVESTPVAEMERVIEVKLKKRRINNNQVLGQLRRQTNSAEKTFLSFVERQLLPVIDALDEGKKISNTTILSLLERFPESKKTLKVWFKTYDVLITGMEERLTKIGIHPFQAIPGDIVDYDLYDPIDVEEDINFDDEQIKETLRRGYLIRYIDGENEEQLLRPGQVVVVMNTRNQKN